MDVDAIFGAFHKLSALTHLTHELRLKDEQIRSVNGRTCGNCDHWMKSTCIPEKQHKQFKSCNSYACGAFEMCPGSKRLNGQFVIERGEIVAKLAALSEEARNG